MTVLTRYLPSRIGNWGTDEKCQGPASPSETVLCLETGERRSPVFLAVAVWGRVSTSLSQDGEEKVWILVYIPLTLIALIEV